MKHAGSTSGAGAEFDTVEDALAREEALREILAVIARSPEDEGPILEAIIAHATRLCQAHSCGLVLARPTDSHQRFAAHHGVTPEVVALYDTRQFEMDPKRYFAARAIVEERVIHVDDMAESPGYLNGDPKSRMLVDDLGIRTNLFVPLVTREGGIGCLILFRKEVRPYTPRQIALVEAFAAQAAIAVENARRFRELATRIEHEAATRRILEVISASRGDEAPVFDVILENASDLCGTPFAGLYLVDETESHARLVASRGARTDYVRRTASEWALDGTASIPRAIASGTPVHIEDLADTDLYRAGDPQRVAAVDTEGMRSFLAVPLLHEGRAIGAIGLYRREVAPFAPDQIALVETFAAQAVIAIENVRQFRELQTRLEREAATREILEVISQNRDDEMPVFRAILERAMRLCGARGSGLQLVDDERTHLRYIVGSGEDKGSFAPGAVTWNLEEPYGQCIAVREARSIHVGDLKDTDLYRSGDPGRVQLVDVEGVRAFLNVPLLQNGVAFGNISLSRREPRPFSPDEIGLIETFAAQAVIAIENVRQFRDLQIRLERERASRDILQVISRSRDDEKPVFDAILESAAKLCRAPHALLLLRNAADTHLELAASNSAASAFVDRMRESPHEIANKGSFAIRALDRMETIHVPDLQTLDGMAEPSPQLMVAVQVERMRTVLVIPLIKGSQALGVICLYKLEASPFSPDEIQLVETFAAQAVIAIENARQFRALQTRLEREAATREILHVISQNPDDDQPVFETILRNAARLCDTPDLGLHLLDESGTHTRLMAVWGENKQVFAEGETFDLSSRVVMGTAIRTARPFQVEDLALDPSYLEGEPIARRKVDEEGVRTLLSVPLVKDGVAFGCINLNRYEPNAYTDADLALLETFAAQAVIAIENARQFRDLQTRLAREQATREILEVISQSRDDEAPVFRAILENARRLCDAPLAFMTMADEARTHVSVPAWVGARPDFARVLQEYHRSIEEVELVAIRPVATGEIVHLHDCSEDELYRQRHPQRVLLVEVEGIRTILAVPMISGGVSIGAILLYRREVKPFEPDQIDLIKAFASQAAIAVENARQFRALAARTEEVQALNASLETRVAEQVEELDRMGDLKRFLSPQVADAIVSGGVGDVLSSHRALLGILFCDIRGFTAFCETAEPEETIEVLQTYHEEMGRLIVAHGAGVDHRSGDGIMVLFNDPLPCEDPAGDALRLAIAMRERMAELCRRWKRLGHRLGFGVGVSLGYATVGMVGSEGRFDYTASGTAVNLASRLCDAAEDGEILLSQRAWIALEDDYEAESAGELTLKGIHAPVEVFRFLGPRGGA